MASNKYVKFFFKAIYLYSVQPRFLLGSWVSYHIFKNRGLAGCQFLEVDGKEEVNFFSWGRGCNFYIKNKLKSEILNSKRKLKT